MKTVIPMLMVIEFRNHHDDDRMEHHLLIGVVGMPCPLTVDVESDFYEKPRVKEISHEGGVCLQPDLRDRFIFACFEQLWPLLDGTDVAELPILDATPWLQQVFSREEADIVLTELRRHVRHDLPIDISRCTSLVPVKFPFKGEPK